MQRDQKLHVQTNEARSTGPAGVTEPPSRLAEGITRGALIVASLTILSRILGLVRTLVFSQTVGATCLGTAYVTANQVPNLLYELILGGALTSAMVPILARSAERAGREPAEKTRVGVITSALLTWTMIIVIPLTVAIIVAAGPIASLLNPSNPNAHCVRADMVGVTGDMLRVFAPQALLYGVSVVLYGLLQSYRRFVGPSIGPGISSLVLIACYLAFVPLNKHLPLAQLPLSAELVLSVGTTLGIAALVVVAIPRPGGCTCGSGRCCGSRRGSRAGRAAWRWSASPNWSPSTWPTSWPSNWPTGAARRARSSCSTTARRCSTPSPRSWPCPS